MSDWAGDKLLEVSDKYIDTLYELKNALAKLTKLTEDNRVLREALENADRLITDGWSVKGRDLIREALAKTAREGE